MARKFRSEFGLNMMATGSMLLQQSELDGVKDVRIDGAPFVPHIYVIGSRPRITVIPSSFEFTPKVVRGKFRKQIRDSFEEIDVVMRNAEGLTDLVMSSAYPYGEFEIYDRAGERISWGNSSLLLRLAGPAYSSHLDLEVLYVGQAYGLEGSRDASDRLASHSTLQHIYSEAIRNSPDKEIWLVLFAFTQIKLASFDGRSTVFQESDEKDRAHTERFLRNHVSEAQSINFTEAALIKYFSAPYNKTYRTSFPNPAHSTYRDCYDLDLNTVVVELQTENMGLRLWSQTVPANWVHFCQFPLNSPELRKQMFEIE